MTTTTARATARSPEQVCDLFALYATAGDVEGLVSLYEPAAQLVLPSGREARGPEQLRAACVELCAGGRLHRPYRHGAAERRPGPADADLDRHGASRLDECPVQCAGRPTPARRSMARGH